MMIKLLKVGHTAGIGSIWRVSGYVRNWSGVTRK